MRAAFAGIVDYAGLFPPAEGSMADAVSRYAAYRASADRWMLGRFVVRAAQLPQLAEAVRASEVPVGELPWPVSVVLGGDPAADLAALGDASRRGDDSVLRVEAVESRVGTPVQILDLARRIPEGVTAFFELPPQEPFEELCDALRQTTAFAKIRTGGVTPDAFPSAATLAAFLLAVTSRGVRFKATAGLHHPMRGRYPLTYRPDAVRHEMFGFVNLLLATAVALRQAKQEELVALLTEQDTGAIVVSAADIRWRDQVFTDQELEQARYQAFLGFGSCSFREPVDELAERSAA